MMMRVIVIVLICGMCFCSAARAQDNPSEPDRPESASLSSRRGFWSAGIGFGAILDPDVPALQTGLDYFVTDDIAVGPMAQLGFGEDAYVVGISGQVKYSAPLAGNQKVRPYGHVGVGFAQIYYKDDDDSITTYLFPIGGGFEFELRPNFNLDIGGTFNVSEDIYLGIFAGVRFVF